MSTNAGSIRRLLALGVTAALALVAAAAVAVQAGAAPSNAQKTIRSGAGPGWPKTLHPSDFVARVDNPWFPLKPGTVYRYRGVKDGQPSNEVFTVTHRAKTIQGVRCTSVSDRLYLAGRLEERTTDWYAQDPRGNVWYFGEATAELDPSGHVTSTEGSWLAGRHGARAGIYMPARPHVGQTGRQEY